MSLCRMCPFLNSPLEKDPLHAWHIYKLCSAELLTDASDSSIFSVDAVVSEKEGTVTDAGLSSGTLNIVQVNWSGTLSKGSTLVGNSSL